MRLCSRDRLEDAQLDVRQRADRERDPVGPEPLDEARVLEAADAVVDPPRLQHVERLPDVLGRPFLAGVGDREQPRRPGALEDGGELPGRMPDLGGVEPHRGDAVLEGERLPAASPSPPRPVRCRRKQRMRRDDIRSACSASSRARRSPDEDGRERDAAVRVRLRIEEDLGVAHAVGVRPLEVRPGEIVEVLLAEQDLGAFVVDVEEGLQAGELIRPADRLHRREAQPDSVALRQLEHQLGLERPFDVEVQLRLRNRGAEVGHGGPPSQGTCQDRAGEPVGANRLPRTRLVDAATGRRGAGSARTPSPRPRGPRATARPRCGHSSDSRRSPRAPGAARRDDPSRRRDPPAW